MYISLVTLSRAEQVVPKPSPFEVQIAVVKFKKCTLSGINQIPTELIQVRGEKLCSGIHKLFNFLWKKEEFHHQWKESITVSGYKEGDRIECSIYQGISPLTAL
jgi:hypothetical protein